MENERLAEELGSTEFNSIESQETLTSENLNNDALERSDSDAEVTPQSIESSQSGQDLNGSSDSTQIIESGVENEVIIESSSPEVATDSEDEVITVSPVDQQIGEVEKVGRDIGREADLNTPAVELSEEPKSSEDSIDEEVTTHVNVDSPVINGDEVQTEATTILTDDSIDITEEKGTEPLAESVEVVPTKEEPVEEVVQIDYSKCTVEELLEAIVDFVRKDDIATIGNASKEIKGFFDIIEKGVRQAAYDKFVADGGDKDSFKFQLDANSQKFLANYQILRERRQKYFKELERQKDENFKLKNRILEELRALVDGEESTTSVKVITQIREKWKNIGPIPRQFSKTLWANYNALMDRFYDNRSIYFELKELDRKKNLELKIQLCEKAEVLGTVTDIRKAIADLNSLHDDFKHIGPVPQENQEELWLRFKAASDVVYSKRKTYIDEIKDQLHGNLEEKLTLCDEIESFTTFVSDRITEWNDKTKEIQELQQKWEKIGGLPRDKSKVVNKRFWSALKGFFANKTKFFKTLEGQKEDNLKLKEQLVQRAEELKDSNDLIKTTDLFKKLQSDWREVGPVPEKVKNAIYKKFKTACDEFFDRKRASVKESEIEFVENLKRKDAICNQIEEISNSDKIDLDMIEALQTQYATIGFVPRNDLKRMNQRYDDVLNSVKDKLDESELSNKDQLSLEIEIRKMKGRPGANKQIERQGHNLRRQITSIENDISTWRNNLEFFSASKTADKLKKDFDVKIETANEELKQLKKQLRMMQAV